MTRDYTSKGSAGTKATGVPKTRQRIPKDPPPLDVPDIEDDAIERKRVLNVLAQRRYREKRRQVRKARAQGEEGAHSQQDLTALSTAMSELIEEEVEAEPAVASLQTTSSFTGTFAPPILELESLPWDTVATTDFPGWLDITPLSSSSVNPGTEEASDSHSSSLIASTLSSPLSFGIASSSGTSDQGFPDSFLLPVYELSLLRALTRISQRIGVDHATLWSLDCLSPFNIGTGTPSDQLPPTWRPTCAQITIPHHPIFDFLPWPGARDKLISVMSLPDESKPPYAAGPMALVNFAYDLEHNAEGVRIYGSDPCDPDSWEVGQVFFERWWFIFDREIIANSNRWRELRGASPLRLKGQ